MEHKREVTLFLLCLIASTMPFKMNIGNMALILATSFTIIFLKKKNLKNVVSFVYLYPIVFFMIAIISSLTSKKYLNGLNRLDLQLLPLLIVIILMTQKITKAILYKVFSWFYISVVIATFILLVNNAIKVFRHVSLERLIFHDFTALYEQHPVYYSMYLSLALFYIFTKKSYFTYKNKALLLFSKGVLGLGLIFCASKAVLFIASVLMVVFYFKKAKYLWKRIAYTGVLGSLIIVTFNISFIKERFVDGLSFDYEVLSFSPTNDFTQKKMFVYDEKMEISDLELRYLLGKIGVYHLIKDHKFYFGYGLGDKQMYLDYYLMSYNLAPNWYEGFNVHNQYLNILITYGFFVLVFFLSYLVYSFVIAIKSKDKLYLFFLILTCFVFIFEVTLVRNKGIIFFFFFNTMFLISNNYENSNFRHKGNS